MTNTNHKNEDSTDKNITTLATMINGWTYSSGDPELMTTMMEKMVTIVTKTKTTTKMRA